MNEGWIDITKPLRNGIPVWPGDPPFELRRVCDIERGDGCNLTAFSTTSHVGTHVDAPLHYIRNAVSVDALPLSAMVGRARIVDLRRLSRESFERGARLIFKSNGIALSVSQAEALAEAGVALAGIDALSIGTPENTEEVHCILLTAGIVILEGLDLGALEPGDYDLVCLPLRLEGAEGAPARVIVRPAGPREVNGALPEMR